MLVSWFCGGGMYSNPNFKAEEDLFNCLLYPKGSIKCNLKMPCGTCNILIESGYKELNHVRQN